MHMDLLCSTGPVYTAGMQETLTCSRCSTVRTVKAGRNKTGLCEPCYQATRSENALPHEEVKRRARAKHPAYYEANKEALQAKSRAWYWANQERAQANAAAWKAANPERKRQHTRKFNLSKYGIEPEIYNKLYAAQQGLCAICELPPETGKNLDVDHCHKTKQVRGLLCNSCNRGIAAFRDSVERLYNAIAYIEGNE